MICLFHANADNHHFSLLQLVSSLFILILHSSGRTFIVLSGCDVLLLDYNELRAQLIYYLIIIVSPFYLCFLCIFSVFCIFSFFFKTISHYKLLQYNIFIYHHTKLCVLHKPHILFRSIKDCSSLYWFDISSTAFRN